MRHPLNIGDFYINNGDCIACGAPESEAPDIIEHSKFENHCYFKKQPSTDVEIDQAINAMMVSCIAALRYGGHDERIIKRLYQDGMGFLCDNKPKGNYSILIRDRVHFDFLGTCEDLSDLVTKRYKSIPSYLEVEDYKVNQANGFSFIQRWTTGARSVIYNCRLIYSKTFEIAITIEKDHELKSLIGISATLHDIIKMDDRVGNIKWYELGKTNDNFFDKPY